MKHSKEDIEESRQAILDCLGFPHSTDDPKQVFCIVRHVSASGMSRVIQLLTFIDGEPRYLGFHAARLLGWSYDRKHEGIKVQGCGMNMCFHTVYTLAQALYKDGYRLREVTL